MVAVGQRLDGVVTIGVDNFEAAREATEHIIHCGHEQIALLGGMPHGRGRLSIPAEREAGFRQALADAGLEVDEDLIVNGNFSIDGGSDATTELLRLPEPPTAIFALSDEMAAGAVRAAREAGVSVPKDLGILGFDDHDFAAAMGITTVRQPVGELGEMAAQALLDAVEGSPWEGNRVLEHQLIERDTSTQR
jgi:DNA-binding LacI/PurR family transcriptional regulator